MLYILVIFVRYLKCGIKYDLFNLAQWPSNNVYFIYMENSLFYIAYYEEHKHWHYDRLPLNFIHAHMENVE